ncbi:MAG: isoaspartyl peptidase/L-asparaginase [Ferrimicrobium sp.]
MLVVASANGVIGIDGIWGKVVRGLDVVTTVEEATWFVEDNVEDHSVGTGGLPNLDGEVELDASIMEGGRRNGGAVAGLKGFRHPISVARAVMERLPHVLVVGEGAARFAKEIGAEPAELLIDSSHKVWEEGLASVPEGLAGEILQRARALTADPERAVGTVNFLALDDSGAMASAVSTSGWAWKWPGRAGDSPIIGAGNYCDSRFGAAACTGFGELAIRASTARTVVQFLSEGASPLEAGTAALLDLRSLGESKSNAIMHLVVLGADGRHAGLSTQEGATYAWRDASSDGTQLLPRSVVSLA